MANPDTISIVTAAGPLLVVAACMAGAPVPTLLPAAEGFGGPPLIVVGAAVTLSGMDSITLGISSPLAAGLASALAGVAHVDGAYLGAETESELTVYVFVKDHGVVQREVLLALEDRFSEIHGKSVILTVRAHQGRPLDTLASSDLLFARG